MNTNTTAARVLRGASIAMIAVLALAACATTQDGAATPTPSSLTEEERGGEAGFRDFAAKVQAAIAAKDATFFSKRVSLKNGECTQEDLDMEGPGKPPCSVVGEKWEAFQLGYWHSHYEYVEASKATAALQQLWTTDIAAAKDRFGTGDAQVYALEHGTDTSVTHVTAMIERPAGYDGQGPLRATVGLRWHFEGGAWSLVNVLEAFVLGEEFLVPCASAVPNRDAWERFPDGAPAKATEAGC